MRIVAGFAKGLTLAGPGRKAETRPTSDKVREALFNIIDVYGSSFLDLYAGSGAVGAEALSRGARRVVLVENDRAVLNVARKNLGKVRERADGSPKANVIDSDVPKFLKEFKREKFDFVFCDPPYAIKNRQEIIAGSLEKALHEGGMLVFETSSKISKELPQPDRIKNYGDTDLLFYTKGK